MKCTSNSCVAIAIKISELKMSVNRVIEERNFYRNKLSEIELLCMEAKRKILECHITLIEKIQSVLHQTKMSPGSNVENHSFTNSDLGIQQGFPLSVYLPSTSANILHGNGNPTYALKSHYDEQAVSSTSPMQTLPKFQSTLNVNENSEEDGKSENACSVDARNSKDRSSGFPNDNKSRNTNEEEQTLLTKNANRIAHLYEEFDGSGANVLKAQNFDGEIIEENVKRKVIVSANRQPDDRVKISYDMVGNGKEDDQLRNLSNDKRNLVNENLSDCDPMVEIGEQTQSLTAEESAEISSSCIDFKESKGIVGKTQNSSDHKATNVKRRSKAIESANEQTGSGIKKMRQDNSVGAMMDNSHMTNPRPALLELPFFKNGKDSLCVGNLLQKTPLLPMSSSLISNILKMKKNTNLSQNDNSIDALMDNSHMIASRPALLEPPFVRNVKDDLSVDHPKQRTPLLPDNSICSMMDNSHMTAPRPALLELPFVQNVKDNLSVEHPKQRTPLLPDSSIDALTDNSHMTAPRPALLEPPFVRNMKDDLSVEHPTQRTPLLPDNSVSAMIDSSHMTAPKSGLLKPPLLQNSKDNGSVEQPTQRTLLETPSNSIISQKSLQNFHPSKKKGVPAAVAPQYYLGPCLKYKTLCSHYAAGNCHQGSKCAFLHPGINGPPL